MRNNFKSGNDSIVLQSKEIESAVNLAAMFIHFRMHKEYGVSQMLRLIDEIKKNGEEAYYINMMD